MTKTIATKSPAEKLLKNSSLIKVDNYYLHSWNLDTECDDGEFIALDFNYTDYEGYDFQYGFTLNELKKAVINGNTITLNDTEGAIVEIKCYKLSPVTLNS